ncbi:FAD-dependent pyridine nucleotide-disulfide oxidoreductase [Stanieria cyanosphaera PCC 7437]|uniref:FAD-dependent pyridine nucleotide-disulfide oxidoreductase n=1 Tax=Stanieria cyanosphaera (strain ATCC 29371 / PCC 7437) TaxID=111780 RepID=K9XY15_STAC7|nr:FAD-dependent oxidoreductase [Stanieria cyanosphaera]AFZ36949.1 FAD-dependent pyridine nucleotide-disulfide oxidoreductase [Stanieria cyanosphaera PCC 7437]
MEKIATDVLVVGGGTGGTVAAIQAARCGVQTVLVSEFVWLGGMLTAAGVAAPDGNELAAWQTGIWGAFIRELQQKQSGGLDHAWVSLFTYDPRVGAAIFADWVQQLPNLTWIQGQTPKQILKHQNAVKGVRFEDYLIEAKITIDGTELGDLLALGDLPHRWGWELQAEFDEPSAPVDFNQLTNKYPVQSPTWVFLLQDYGEDNLASEIIPNSQPTNTSFQGAWDNYGTEEFLNYGRLPNNLFMINWPIGGNDYGRGLNRLIESETEAQFLREAYDHSLDFAHYIQSQLGKRYGLASSIFPGNNAFALHPYYRESRRLRGQITITEHDILSIENSSVAPLPKTTTGEINATTEGSSEAIAIGNYPNDHHYPGEEFTLQPKSIHWGGRWTGTPFTIPYGALFSEQVEGFLVCEKNISVSHIANGSTRLQPVVMNIGQAAGMAAALCVQTNCQPWELSIRSLQEALITDRDAPAAVIPLFNLPPEHPEWLKWQRYYLDHPEDYPGDGNCFCQNFSVVKPRGNYYQGIFSCQGNNYQISLIEPNQIWQLITIYPDVEQKLREYPTGKLISVVGRINASGNWLLIEAIL